MSFSGRLLRGSWSGNSPAVQWLGLRKFTTEGPGSIPSQGTKIPASHLVQHPPAPLPCPKKKRFEKKAGGTWGRNREPISHHSQDAGSSFLSSIIETESREAWSLDEEEFYPESLQSLLLPHHYFHRQLIFWERILGILLELA